MRGKFLAIILFLLPIFFLPIVMDKFDPMHSARGLLFLGVCWCMAAIGGKRGLWQINKPLAIFGCYLVAWQMIRIDSIAFMSYFLPAIAGIIAFPFLASLDDAGKTTACRAVVCVGLLQAVITLLQLLSPHLPPWKVGNLVWPAFYFPPIQMFGKTWLLFYPHDAANIGHAFGTMSGTNPLGFLLAIAALLSLGCGMGWAIFLMFPALIATKCLGALLAFCAGIFFFIWRLPIMPNRRRTLTILALVLLAILGVGLSLHGITDSGRLEAWSVAFKTWTKGIPFPTGSVQTPWAPLRNPIIGWGPGSFMVIFPIVLQPLTTSGSAIEAWDRMHCEYLQVLWEYGFVGLILLGFFLSGIIRKIRQQTSLLGSAIAAAVVAIMVDSLVFFPFQIVETALLSLTLVAFLHGDQQPENVCVQEVS